MLMLMLLLAARASAYPGPYPPGGSCNVNGPQQLCIAAPFSSNAVLQREPASAAITGSVPQGWGSDDMSVTVTLADDDGAAAAAAVGSGGAGWQHAVTAAVRADRTWKVLLPPRPTAGNYSLTAQCSAGCSGANASFVATLLNLTFGDVYVCSGQSCAPIPTACCPHPIPTATVDCRNMQLMMDYTFEVNTSVAAIKQGKYDNIRLFYGPMNFDYATNRTDIWVIRADQAGDPVGERGQLSTGGWRYPRNVVEPIPNGHNLPPFYLSTEFGRMYSTCWYTFEALTDAMIAAGETPPPFGLIAVAVGGTKIAQWVEWGAQGQCSNVTCCDTPDCTQSPPYPGGPNPCAHPSDRLESPHIPADPLVCAHFARVSCVPFSQALFVRLRRLSGAWLGVSLLADQPINHVNCSGNAQLYNGLIAPLVNTTIRGRRTSFRLCTSMH